MRMLLRIAGGLVALVLVVYLAVNLAVVAEARQQRGQIADQVTAELEQALPAAADRQQDVIAAASSEPDVRWIEQVCKFDSDDAGWMVQGYREVCSVRSVAGWRVETSEEARSVLAVQGQEGVPYDGCQPLGTADDAEVTYVDDATSDGEPACTATLGTSGQARVLVGERAAIGPGRWLLAVDEQPLVDEGIGCAHWSVLFCDNPFGDDHAFGEAPDS